MPRLRIALISLHTSPFSDPGRGDVGGMNVVVKHLSLALAERGHEVSVFTRRTSPTQPEYEDIAAGLRLYFLTAGPADLLSKPDQVEWIADFSYALAAHGPWDIIHSHHWLSGLAALPIAQEAGIPHVQSYHSIAAAAGAPLSDGEPPESAQRQVAERSLAQHSTALLAISQAEAATITGRLGAEANRVQVISPGVDVKLFQPAKPDEEVLPQVREFPRYILAAARLEPLKGMELAIETLSLLPQASRPHLVIAGEATAGMEQYERDLKQLPLAMGVAENVHFIGSLPRPEFAHLMRHADLLVVPSYSETYGLVALEAAASGIPSVAFAAGGLVEAVHDGVTGVLLQSRDPQQWAQAISHVIEEPAHAQQLGAQGRAQALTMTWEKVAEEMTDAYCHILNEQASTHPRNCLV